MNRFIEMFFPLCTFAQSLPLPKMDNNPTQSPTNLIEEVPLSIVLRRELIDIDLCEVEKRELDTFYLPALTGRD